jgi:uncharacterized protein YukE
MTSAKLGGYEYRNQLALARQDAEEVIRLLDRLSRVANNAETKAQILEGQVACYRMRERVAECLLIGRKEK